jgi:hypothetical protein
MLTLTKVLPALISSGSFTGSFRGTTDLSTITNTQELKNVWPNILNES